MTYTEKLIAIKRILDEKFTEETPLYDIEIIRCEVEGDTIVSASVYDHNYGCPVIIRIERSSDGYYSITQYAW